MSISSLVNSRTSKARVKRAGSSSLSPSSRPTTPPMPIRATSPSSPPRRNPPSAKSPHKSPARSFSLSGKPRTTFTGQIIVPSIPASELVRPPYDTAPNSTIRRSVSDESIQVRSGRSSSEPPAPPPKEPPLLAYDPLFQAARLKLSSRDQEAMRKIRSTMNSDSSDTQSRGNPSPLSPLFPNHASGSGSIGRMRSRGSALSKQVFAMDHEAEAGPSVPRSLPDKQVGGRVGGFRLDQLTHSAPPERTCRSCDRCAWSLGHGKVDSDQASSASVGRHQSNLVSDASGTSR